MILRNIKMTFRILFELSKNITEFFFIFRSLKVSRTSRTQDCVKFADLMKHFVDNF
ncbi:hypothetical protein HanRHA438_Chr11g0513021 [Helianthus annuus]|nr:hypothetical protein HanIR_Chr11g0538571 [Helianthus annuus]KAJ0871496.1 hypothetical protein HanRHA438_Chr11g0513021 [Helianthus annuus]